MMNVNKVQPRVMTLGHCLLAAAVLALPFFARAQGVTAANAADVQAQIPKPEAAMTVDTSASASSVSVLRASAVRNVGASTRHLLAAQAQGLQASPLQYSMPIDVANKVYERYLNSFTHEIPEHLGSALNEVRTQN